MRILHISAECFPAAKVGGLGDVVGALPQYLCEKGIPTAVIIPKYQSSWITKRRFTPLYHGLLKRKDDYLPFSIEQVIESDLRFPLLVVKVKDRFEREGVYSDPETGWYEDDTERRIYFQRAVLQWLMELPELPELLHCHDHHSGLIPFLLQHCPQFERLRQLPTVFTIHNGAYHGTFSEEQEHWLPPFADTARPILKWGKGINPLVAGIRSCQRLTTVSPSYLKELQEDQYGLGKLLRSISSKSKGILNGIDNDTWNPKKDKHLHLSLSEDIKAFKAANKKWICEHFDLDPQRPLITFIGRLVGEKGADLLPNLISRYFHKQAQANFVILGTGEAGLEDTFDRMRAFFRKYFGAALEYNEQMAHQLYAGSDFLLMPSRVEPCGLNQLYAFRYGTIPIVRSTGGLQDTVLDVEETEGRGIRFENFKVNEALIAINRATQLYENKEKFHAIRQRIMKLNFSWEKSAEDYIEIYKELT